MSRNKIIVAPFPIEILRKLGIPSEGVGCFDQIPCSICPFLVIGSYTWHCSSSKMVSVLDPLED